MKYCRLVMSSGELEPLFGWESNLSNPAREDFAGGGVGERSPLDWVALVKVSVCTELLCTPRAFML